MNAPGFIIVDVSRLVKAPWNYKTDDTAMTARLERNIMRHQKAGRGSGQLMNLIVRHIARNKLEVVNGNHRYDVLQKLSVARALVYDLGTVSEKEAQRIAVETNESKFPVNWMRYQEHVADIARGSSVEEIAASLPLREEEIRAAIRQQEWTWKDIRADAAPNYHATQTAEVLVKVAIKKAKQAHELITNALNKAGVHIRTVKQSVRESKTCRKRGKALNNSAK